MHGLRLDIQAIQSKLSELPVEDHPNFVPELDIEHALNLGLFQDLFASQFQCAVCSRVVQNPEECQNCEKVFCANCINKWLEGNQTCALCREVYLKKAQVNRFTMSVLKTLRFQCQQCPSSFSYTEAAQHLKGHLPLPVYPCPFRCKNENFLVGRQGVEQHLLGGVEGQCPNSPFVCWSCGEKGTIGQLLLCALDQSKASCQQRFSDWYREKVQNDELREKLLVQTKQNADLQKENAMLKEKLKLAEKK